MRHHAWIVALCSVACIRHEAFRWDDCEHVPLEEEVAVLDPAKKCGRTEDDKLHPSNNEQCSDAKGELFRLAFAEIDDQGTVWDPLQIEHTFAFLDAAHEQGALVVVFVHGWRHDAGTDDSNVSDFRRVLFAIAEGERVAKTGRAVRGLYLGWRAHPFNGTPFTTFWARKKGAHRVGERDGGRVLDELGALVQGWRADERERLGAERTRALLVGHSFGAALVHSAVSRQLQRDLATDDETPPALAYDLIALVNPAFEAASFRPLYEIGANGGADPTKVQPALVMVTTKADCNTARHFRMGMNGFRGEGVYRDDQKDDRRTGAGHHPWAGRLEADAIECSDTRPRGSVLGAEKIDFVGDSPGEDETTPGPDPEIGSRHCKDFCHYTKHNTKRWCRLKADAPRRPVTVVYDTQSELMDHHSDAFTFSLWTFLTSIADRAIDPPALSPRTP